MTKRKSVVSKMLLLVVILTLVSCCFLGSTFARYTSTGSGTGTVNVANWSFDFKGGPSAEESMDVEFAEQLSPSKYDYNTTVGSEYTAQTPRTNETGKILVATITYNIEVDATFTLDTGDGIIFKGADGKVIGADSEQSTTAFGTSGVKTDGKPTKAEVEEVFSIKLYVNETSNDAAGATLYAGEKALSAGEGTLYIYAEVTWTSDTNIGSSDGKTEISGTTADTRDTWIGTNISSVGWELTYTAVQATELPTA